MNGILRAYAAITLFIGIILSVFLAAKVENFWYFLIGFIATLFSSSILFVISNIYDKTEETLENTNRIISYFNIPESDGEEENH